MISDLKPYTISLSVGQIGWNWMVTDDEGELILFGRKADIRDAAAEALEKLEAFIQEATNEAPQARKGE
jgi:hypothetical protein